MTVRSPLAPLFKGGNGFKVPLKKGDLGGSTRSKLITSNLGYIVDTPHEKATGLPALPPLFSNARLECQESNLSVWLLPSAVILMAPLNY
ncbi:MAG TPA: hypothetical protein DEA78_09570 [Cyanobacteria bacterium UBA11159]|nr:hypothetical protein [Cyanobacteria bacterium UBA11367]HBR73941.1 hypothetical protein [Cyanobacteria bacterium UBA11159]HBS69627.1 hypothetical protein [Cyanobacteria bacterium UBA11153]HCA96421.1 hypothetical protein [Cyanobacteria bacterium UBA9226]